MEEPNKRDPYGLVGKILDKYELLEFVGIGGMGVVYRARHIITEGIVAVKVLKPDLAILYPEMHEYFFTEAKRTVSLNHPYIIKISDTGIADERAYLVMEWLAGYTLEDEIKASKASGVMKLERISMLLEQISEAAAHAHSKGIIHRDLKPGNIMVVKDYQGRDTVKIVDFGIAKALTSTMGATSRVMGAPYYASPEQLTASADIDHRSDIYTLGVILHQMLTGKVPFDTDSDTDSIEGMIFKHTKAQPPPIRQLRPELSEALERVILRALAKRPADRYQSAIDLARAFRQAARLETGTVLVQCLDAETGASLPGAAIYINGRSAGDTDEEGWWVRKDFSSGEYLVEVDCFQYLPWSKRVRISPPEEVEIPARLSPTSVGELIIRTTVAGAEVFLNGIMVGTTDEACMLYVKDLPPGQSLAEIRHPKHHPVELKVEIIQGQVWHGEAELIPLPRRSPVRENIKKLISAISPHRRASVRYCGECGAIVRKGMKFCDYCKTPVDEAVFKREWSFKALTEFIRRNFSARRKPVVVVASSLIFVLLILGGVIIFGGKKPEPPVVETHPRPSPSVTPESLVPTPTPQIIPEGTVYVPGGTFTMGRDTVWCSEYETPAHMVTVEPFYIDKYEVTNEQYARFIEANPKQSLPSTWIGGKYPPGTALMPVTGVSWKEANAYAEWAGKSLPTEEEWEFAARGTDGRIYPWGTAWASDIVNAEKGEVKFDKVGSHPSNASPFGVCDMVGNAWEWTASDLTVYPGSRTTSPPRGIFKVLRGGSSSSPQKQATTTCRYGWRFQKADNNRDGKVYCDPDNLVAAKADGSCDYSSTGFRCVVRKPQSSAR